MLTYNAIYVLCTLVTILSITVGYLWFKCYTFTEQIAELRFEAFSQASNYEHQIDELCTMLEIGKGCTGDGYYIPPQNRMMSQQDNLNQLQELMAGGEEFRTDTNPGLTD